MNAKPQGKGGDALVAIATITPVFVIAASLSTSEKALLTATVFSSVWIAVSKRWQLRSKQGFWPWVGFFALVNALAIWALPVVGPFQATLSVSYPLGMAEGFLPHWLLGRMS